MFSDAVASKIDSSGKDSFTLTSATNDLGNELTEVFFSENGMGYRITYDKYSGIPYSIDAGNDKLSVSLILSDFTITE